MYLHVRIFVFGVCKSVRSWLIYYGMNVHFSHLSYIDIYLLLVVQIYTTKGKGDGDDKHRAS